MIRLCIVFLIGVFSSVCVAHEVDTMLLTFKRADSSWNATILFDASLADPELRDDKDAPQPTREWLLKLSGEEYSQMRREADTYLRDLLVFSSDDKSVPITLSFPDFASASPNFPSLLDGGAYMTVVISGEFGAESENLEINVSKGNGPEIIVATSDFGQMGYLRAKPGQSVEVFYTEPQNEVKQKTANAMTWLILGYQHVIPDGLDHILFILCLFLMLRKWKSLLWQSALFTLAHSLTLGFAISGMVQIQQWPAWIQGSIEPLIAFSILALAVENLLTDRVSSKRLLMVFLFGLIHGLGFAGSLGTSLQQGGPWLFPLALANIGVELAQATVLLLAWLVTMKIAQGHNYRKFEKCSSAVIALVAAWIFLSRVI